jgi:3D-(3,5/4)-trihydroxycyclohexane-1,2-dione acylhydrolase (decyclizing)
LGEEGPPTAIDFAGHARSLGAVAEQVKSIADLEAALVRARKVDRTSVTVIETDPLSATTAGGAWWDVAIPEVSTRPEVRDSHDRYLNARRRQRLGG